MMSQPFILFRPFEKQLSVAIVRKEDDVRSDTDAAQKIGVTHAAGLHQVHGNNVVIIREPTARIIQADGMITDVPDLALCIRWADCQNFVVFAPEKNILGAMHVGWKCLRAGTIPAFFALLREKFAIDGKDCFVAGGPSLCTQCSEFTDPLKEISNVPKEFVHGRTVDLRGWAEQQLQTEGVLMKQFERQQDCTRCMPEHYWTYRGGDREEVMKGRTNMIVCGLRKSF